MKFIKHFRQSDTKSSSSSPISSSSEHNTENHAVAQVELNRLPTVIVNNAEATHQIDSANDNEDVEKAFHKSLGVLRRETRKLQLMMENVIPEHLIGELREDMMAPNRGNFQKSYLRYYESVSILFADIVGFTKISSKCTAEDLVLMLNELFGRFDKAAERNRCLRIKILGDCYYCVSGVPANVENPEPHAKQCVEMGLDMIDILAELALDWRVPTTMPETITSGSNNNSHELDLTTTKGLNMRIGIHTGQVLCGIMGKKKWQFDVHSNDVKLANHLEQAGMPGRVHITRATLKQLGTDYQVEPANGRDRDGYIASVDMDTYFVIAPGRRQKNSSLPQANSPMKTVAQMPDPSRQRPSSRATPDKSGGGFATTVVDHKGQTSLATPNAQVSLSTIASKESTPHVSASSQRLEAPSVIVPKERYETIVTQDRNNERVSLLMAAQQLAANSPEHSNQWMDGFGGSSDRSLGESVAMATTDDHENLQTFSGTAAAAARRKSKSSPGIQMASLLLNSPTGTDLSSTSLGSSSTANNLIANANFAGSTGRQRFKRTTRALINANHFIRTIDVPFANLDSESTTFEMNIDENTCDTIARFHNDLNKWNLRFKEAQMSRLYHAQQPDRLVKLVRACVQEYKNVTIPLILTLVLMTLISLMTTVPASSQLADLKQLHGAASGGWNFSHLVISLIAALTLAALILTGKLIYNLRRVEMKSRIDFIEKASLEQKRESYRSIFFNILPQHVAEYFLQSRGLAHRELYSKPYETIGVSFATVTNFDEFYQEEEANDHGKGCLNLLNEIICDFDDLLDYDRFKAIDKIKTIGTTYMAAIGLLPEQCEQQVQANLASTSGETDSKKLAQQIRTMLEFIMEMRHCLTDISENSFNTYRLRAGINLGPVTAGVICATKPQYDIWGNTVNVASRMESTCEPNRIQVTEEVYCLLKEFFDDLEFTCRGEINIKGKGMMKTYYVDLLDYESVKPVKLMTAELPSKKSSR